MFHWICPECGREIPPAVTECPACDPTANAARKAAPAAGDPEPAPDLLLALAEQIRGAQLADAAEAPTAPAAGAPPVVKEPVPEALPARAAETPAAPVAKAPSAEEPKPEPASPSVEPAGLTELANAVGLKSAPSPEPVAPAEPRTLVPVQTVNTAQPESVATATNPESVATATNPESVATATLPQPIAPPASSEAAAQPIQELAPAPAELAPAAGPAALALAEPAPAPDPVPVAVAEPVPPQQIASVQLAPPPALLPVDPPKPEAIREPEPPTSRPPSGSWLPMAPLQRYQAAASRAMQPIAPAAKILSPDTGPRITLPGPALPPGLNSLQDSHVVTVIGDQGKKRGMPGVPGWVVSFLVMTVLLVAGVALVFYLLPSHSAADAKAAPPAAPVTEAAVAAAAASPVTSHPLSESIEVTGFRFVVDFNKKSEIHYLVVNHSATELNDMTIYITLRTANAKPGQPPLCRFSFRSPGLAPFESKEMTSAIEKLPRTVALPDWQDLRPEVQITQ